MQILDLPQVRMLMEGLNSKPYTKERLVTALKPIQTTQNSLVALVTKDKRDLNEWITFSVVKSYFAGGLAEKIIELDEVKKLVKFLKEEINKLNKR